jgi:hypothetical protein
MAAALEISDEMALEGYLHFVGVREGKAERYPFYVAARKRARDVLKQLAELEARTSTDFVYELLDEALAATRPQP